MKSYILILALILFIGVCVEVAHAYPYDPNELGYIADRYGNRGLLPDSDFESYMNRKKIVRYLEELLPMFGFTANPPADKK